MARRILVVDELDDAARTLAEAQGIGEIVVGIPAAFRRWAEENDITLPYVYEEPEIVPDTSEDDEFRTLQQLLGPDWAGSEAAWAGLTAAQKTEHLRLRSNALRNGLLWLYRYTKNRDVE